jgi:hypothetical protein
MPRETVLLLLALALAAYGVYTALYIPAMFVGPPMPLLIICFLAQVLFALAAAVAIWRRQSWAAAALLLLAAAIAVTQLVEVLLGILPYLRAILVSLLAIGAALLLSVYVNRAKPLTEGV